MILAEKQIRYAFEQAQKEVDYLHTRTKEGMMRAKEAGHIAGRRIGSRVETRKAISAKETIRKHNKSFGGSLSNEETWRLAGISKISFYKYKREILDGRES
jgi:DNA invertase Pin-like site-specific DNA recombinase